MPPEKRNICAVIVTYFPDRGFFDRFPSVVDQVGGAVIVDNRSDSASTDDLRRLASANVKTRLILNEVNRGVAAGLNQGCGWAKEHGYEWVLTLDQDTLVAGDMVEKLIRIYHNDANSGKIAAIGSNFTNANSGKPWGDSPSQGKLFMEKDFVITSGCLQSLAAFGGIGSFRDDFFIDAVDIEYCLRARSKGYRILMSTSPLMKQSVGNATAHHFLRWTLWTNNRPPLRWYYGIRNHILVVRMYARAEWKWALAGSWSLLKESLKMCCFERDRAAKVKAIISGVKNGFAVKPAAFGECR